MPYLDYRFIRLAVPIQNVLNMMGWRRRTLKCGTARGPCPFHSGPLDKSRSFAVNYDTDRWYCHRCKDGGDVIDLYARWKGLGTYEAAVKLCEERKLTLPKRAHHQASVPDPWYGKGTEKRNGHAAFGPPAGTDDERPAH